MLNLGKLRPGSTIRIPFSTFDKDDGSSITMTDFAAGDILVYKDGSTTERASTSGYTATTDFDSKTGKHLAILDLSDNTTAGFWNAGSEYLVAVDSVTVDAVSVGGWIARFSIGYEGSMFDTTIASLSSQTSFTLTAGPAEDDALNGCTVVIHDIASAVQCSLAIVSDYTGATKTVTLAAGATFTAAAGDNIAIMFPQPLQPAVAGRTVAVDSSGVVDANATKILGTTVATPATAGVLDVNAKAINNVATTSVTTVNANVGLTQPLNFTGTGASALAKSDVVDIAGAAVSTSTAQLGVNVVNLGGSVVDASSGLINANVKQISTDATAADNLETMLDGTGGQELSLGKLNIVNSAGSAIVATSSGSNGHGAVFTGNGSGEGISATGGATGHGMELIGGATSGDGLKASGTTSGHGANLTGVGVGRAGLNASGTTTGAGIKATGGSSGSGIEVVSGGTLGDGITVTGTNGNGIAVSSAGGNGDGLQVIANGSGIGLRATGGSTGDGIRASAGGGNAHGFRSAGSGTGEGVSAQGGVGGNGIEAIGGAASGATPAGHGFKTTGGAASTTGGGTSGAGVLATGGAGAASTNGASEGIAAIGGGTTTVTGGAGITSTGTGNLAGVSAAGAGSGDGIKSTGGATGHGMSLVGGGTSGDGLHASATDGDGIEAIGAGTGYDILADIQGNVTGNLSGSIGSLGATAKADVNAEADTALADYDGPTHTELVSEIDDVQTDIVGVRDRLSTLVTTYAEVQTDGGNSATQILTDLTETEVDHWKFAFVKIVSGDLIGQVRKVTGYDGAGTLTFTDGFTATPADTTQIEIVND